MTNKNRFFFKYFIFFLVFEEQNKNIKLNEEQFKEAHDAEIDLEDDDY